MSNPVIQAFFLGRALAEVLSEKLEDSFTNAMSELGKFDAEQRENLRQFVEEVQLRAGQVAANNSTDIKTTASSPNSSNQNPQDLQAMLDQLRAEIASLKAALNNYRQQ